MKIIILTNTFIPELGAAPARWFDVAQQFVEEGFEVEIITGMPCDTGGNIHPSYQNKKFIQEKIGSINIRRHRPRFMGKQTAITRFLGIFSMAFAVLADLGHIKKSRPDWIMAQYPPTALPFIALLAARLSGANFALNCSDLWSFGLKALGIVKNRWLLGLYKKAEHFLMTRASLLVAQNQETRRYIAEVTGHSPLLMRTGADCSRYAFKNTFSSSDEPLKIIYAGVTGLAHGLAETCRQTSFNSLGAQLHIYGDGAERKKIASLPQLALKGIYLHDPVPASEMPALLQRFDVALVTQKKAIYGTVPSKIYEAMSSGLPVMYHGGTGEGADIVLEYGCGLFSGAEDLSQLHKNVQQLSENRNLLPVMGKKGRRAAVCHFDRRQHIKILVNFLQNEANQTIKSPQNVTEDKCEHPVATVHH